MDDLVAGVGGVIGDTDWVPTIEPGVYDVVVTETSGISVTVELTVTENTYVTVSPLTAPATYSVDIEGYNFAHNPDDKSLTFLLYNDTDEWTLDVLFESNPVQLEDGGDDWDDGYFEGTFDLPADDTVSIGSYMINVTSGDGMWAQVAFDVVSKTVGIDPKKTVFRVGETLGFNVETSFKQEDSWIKIWDPSGNLYWQTDAFDADVWVKVGTIMRVPYYSQVAGGNPMTFLEDAPLGTWTWKWYIYDSDEGENVVLDEGTFTVEAAAQDVVAGQVEDLANQITDLASQLEDVSGEFSDVKSDIANVAAVAQQAVAAAQQAAQAVQTVATTANQANTAAQAAADAANAAKDAANGLTTLVYGAIGAALVAALAAIVSLMQISRRIAG
jgi:chaperonin cofactor prefoldin